LKARKAGQTTSCNPATEETFMLAVVCWLTIAGQLVLCGPPQPEAEAQKTFQQDLDYFADFPDKKLKGPVLIREDDPRWAQAVTFFNPTI
jgi:hypothetical protein